MMQRRSDERKGGPFVTCVVRTPVRQPLHPQPSTTPSSHASSRDCLHAFDPVLDHGLRPGAVHVEAQDAKVRLCTHLSVGNDSQGLTEPRWRDTRLQPPSTGAKTAGWARTNSSCCSGVSLTMPQPLRG